jgi:hypothetical protein
MIGRMKEERRREEKRRGAYDIVADPDRCEYIL